MLSLPEENYAVKNDIVSRRGCNADDCVIHNITSLRDDAWGKSDATTTSSRVKRVVGDDDVEHRV